MQFSKRARPKGCQDIGQWITILDIIAILSVFTNAALLVFNANHFFYMDYFNKMILFMGLVFLFILVKIIISSFETEDSSRLLELQNRQTYVFEKMTKGKNIIKDLNQKKKRTFLGIYFG